MEANRALVGVCAWCGEPAYTRLITKSANRRRKIRTPVCDAHELRFTSEGASSERLEMEKHTPQDPPGRPRGAPHRR